MKKLFLSFSLQGKIIAILLAIAIVFLLYKFVIKPIFATTGAIDPATVSDDVRPNFSALAIVTKVEESMPAGFLNFITTDTEFEDTVNALVGLTKKEKILVWNLYNSRNGQTLFDLFKDKTSGTRLDTLLNIYYGVI